MTDSLSLREALRGIFQADKYPILGNEDWPVADRLSREALEHAATAVPSVDDSPEWAGWIASLRDPRLPNNERDEIMYAIHDLFEPDDEGEA